VIGILIALQVNNWNEQRKLDVQRQELVADLISDMSATRARLSESIDEVNELIHRTERFLSVSHKPELNADLPVDTLRYLASWALATARVEPVLTTYNQAVSSGHIGLINNPRVLEHFSQLLLAYNDYKQHLDLSGRVFYLGSIWQVRQQVGNIYAFGDNSSQRSADQRYMDQAYFMTDQEYRDFIANPDVYAAVHNVLTIYYNLRISFTNMDESAARILAELNQAQK